MKYSLFAPFALLLLMGCNHASYSKEQQSSKAPYDSKDKSIAVYSTTMEGTNRLTPSGKAVFGAVGQPLETEASVFVNPEKSYQTFLGIGAAITDASAEVFAQLPAARQQEVLKAYFSNEGIGYSLLRTTIHSSDFASASYTYIEEGDEALKSFSIAHDLRYRVPMIKQAIEMAKGNITLYASPWSPPAFMKDNNNMLKGGHLLPKYYQAWANYYVKFIQAYEQEGLKIWGVTLQNEPLAVQRWESCIYSAEQERDFLKIYLGPTLAKAGLSEKKIVVWDHNRDLLTQRANVIFSDPEAAKYAWGIGFHWYETWSGGEPKFDNVARVHEDFPSKNLLFTEGCVESFKAENYQRWSNAERYGRNMINDFNNGTVGWTDWNILLDQNGGPNHVGNFCFAPIHANTQTGDLIYTPSYYYIGHFSKFIHPGAVRISTSTSRSAIISTSFRNLDGSMVTVVMNESDKAVSYKLQIGGSAASFELPAHAIQSLVY